MRWSGSTGLLEARLHYRRKTKSTGADAQLFKAKLFHQGLIDQNPGKDDIRAHFGQAGDFLALASDRRHTFLRCA